jgi:uncharacterized repeat protein (TIGR01451 family)
MRTRHDPLATPWYKGLALVLVVALASALAAAPAGAAPGDTADLVISGSSSAPGIKVGHDLVFTLEVVNDGPDAATNVTVEVVPDPDMTIEDATASGGTCTTTATAVCSRDSLDPTGIFEVTVRATTSATGPADTTAAVESDTIDTSVGNNVVSFSTRVGPESSRCDLWGTAGSDRISGGREAEVICGRGGGDRLLGRGSNDRLFGGAGKDRLTGGAGNDALVGGPGADRLVGGHGRDRCRRSGGDVRRTCE